MVRSLYVVHGASLHDTYLDLVIICWTDVDDHENFERCSAIQVCEWLASFNLHRTCTC